MLNVRMSYLYWAVCILLLTYVIICAAVVPFSVDEAWTYEEFIKGNFWNVVRYDHPVANNHLLNSLAAKPFAVISSHELSLRMPNVLAFILYMYAGYRIANILFTNKLLQFCLFVSLMCNNALLHFFALCRGYGLSIGLLLFAVAQLFAYYNKPHKKRLMHISLFSAVMACYASFVMLHAYCAIAICFACINYMSFNKVSLKGIVLNVLGAPTIYTALLLLLVARPIMLAMQWNELYWGGDRNFFSDTVTTALQDVLGYKIMGHYGLFIIVSTVTIVMLSVAFVAIRSIKQRIDNSISLIVPFILMWCVLFVNLQFYFMDSKLLIYRTAMYLYPLTIMTIFSAIYVYRDRMAAKIKAALCTIILIIALLPQLNVDTVSTWWFDNDNKKVLSDISDEKRRIKLYTFELSSNSFNYYIGTRLSNQFYNVPRIAVNQQDSTHLSAFDYIYTADDFPVTIPPQFKLVRRYCNGRTALYRK